MENFADQCLDLARSTLGQNLDSINDDGSISPVGSEQNRSDEPGHAALAIGEFYRATQETTLEGKDLIDLAARCITAQAFDESQGENMATLVTQSRIASLMASFSVRLPDSTGRTSAFSRRIR